MKARICGWLTDHPIWEVTDGHTMYNVTLDQYTCYRPRLRGNPDNYKLDPRLHFKIIDTIDDAISKEKKLIAGTVQDALNRRQKLSAKQKEDAVIDKFIMSVNDIRG